MIHLGRTDGTGFKLMQQTHVDFPIACTIYGLKKVIKITETFQNYF